MKTRILIAIVTLGGFFASAASAQTAAGTATGQKANTKKASRKQAATANTPVDLNSASKKELDSLPGVGAATAKKIIDNRPYRSVDDLNKAGIAAKEVDRIRPLVTVSAAGAAPASIPAPSARTTPAPATGQAERSNPRSVTPPPAGSGMVWVNTETKVYHREGDPWYGKTKHGSYMPEADAVRAGYRAAKK